MLWPNDSLDAVFAQIKKNSQQVDLSTLIISSLETDSLCATEMLSDALKTDNVLHTVHTVRGGFAQVHDLLLPLLEQGNFKSIILINCGATIDLSARYGDILADGAFIFVIDSHRPIAHQNLLPTTSQVIVLGGEIATFDETVIPSADLPDDISDDEEEEEEEKPAAQEEEEAFDEHSNASRREEEDEIKPQSKRMRRVDRLAEYQELARIHQEYYTGSYLGDPSSHVMFQMCSQAGKETSALVWNAIVGITWRYTLCNDLDDKSYAYLLHEYRELVKNRNIHVKQFRHSVDDHSTLIPNASAQDQIEFLPHEINLVLYRNWSLVEACKHTELFAVRFRAWNMGGNSEVNMFFAKMGLSLSNAEQKYQFMPSKAKQLVHRRIAQTAAEYNYNRMTYPSFVRRSMGFDIEISAEDCARCISTALEEAAAADDEGFTRASGLLRHGRRDKREWSTAITACINKVRLLNAETLATVQGNLIQSAGDFRWAFIDLHEEEEANEDGDRHSTERGEYFSTAHGVVALAQSVLRANFEKWVNRNSVKPLVLAVAHRGQALVCGLPCPSELGTVQKNPFGEIFRKTVHALQLNDSVDLEEFPFDFVIRLESSEVQRFLLTLTKT